MEIKLNLFERGLMKLGDLLFGASRKVKEIVYKRYDKDLRYTFLDRQYKSDGDGGLFRIRGVDVDLTKVDIWTQLCWYLDSIS